jgi:hypothetical protein
MLSLVSNYFVFFSSSKKHKNLLYLLIINYGFFCITITIYEWFWEKEKTRRWKETQNVSLWWKKNEDDDPRIR